MEILKLWGNIGFDFGYYFREILTEETKKIIFQNIGYIELNPNDLSLRLETPKVDIKSNKITLEANFLSGLWSFSYFFLLFNEELNWDKKKGAYYSGHINMSSKLRNDSLKLFSWAISLRKFISPWPNGLPTPEIKSCSPKRNYYSKKANNIFINACSFLILHEIGHLSLGHQPTADPQISKEMELQADNFSRTTLFLDDNPELAVARTFGVIIANIYSIFLVGPDKISQTRHPDLDERLNSSRAFISDKLPNAKVEYFNELVLNSVKIYCGKFGIKDGFPDETDSAVKVYDKLQSELWERVKNTKL